MQDVHDVGSSSGRDADTTPVASEVSIASLYRHCIQSFEQLCGLFELSKISIEGVREAEHQQTLLQNLLDEFGRFRVWAANAGAHRTGRVSLDYRLREASHIHGQVTGLLEELDKDLQESIRIFIDGDSERGDSSWRISLGDELIVEELGSLGEEEDDETELEGVLADIAHIVACLYRFSIAVRNPIPRDKIHKIATIDVSHFEHWDVQHISHKFPEAPEYLIKRLGKANTMRRQLLRYYQDHHHKIARYTDAPLHHDLEGNKNTSIPINKGPATISAVMKSRTTVSTIKIKALDILEEGTGAAGDQLSQTSYASSRSHHGMMLIPPPPNARAVYNGQPFECPYCFQIIKVGNSQIWKKHVFRDLQPYVCTQINCPQPGKLYDSQNAWYMHEIQVHRREWFCNECSLPFPTKFVFDQHITETHPEIFMDNEKASLLVSRCERSRTTTVEPCVFCYLGLHHSEVAKHLGKHMQEAALFTLPCRVDKENTSEQEKSADQHHLRSSLGNSALTFDSNPDRRSNPESGSTMQNECLYVYGDPIIQEPHKDPNTQIHDLAARFAAASRTPAAEFPCDRCQQNFPSENSWRTHLNEAHPDVLLEPTESSTKTDKRPHKCIFLGCKYARRGFPTAQARDTHWIDKHSVEAPISYHCLFHPCTYKSRRDISCKQHMENAHGYKYVRKKENYRTHDRSSSPARKDNSVVKESQTTSDYQVTDDQSSVMSGLPLGAKDLCTMEEVIIKVPHMRYELPRFEIKMPHIRCELPRIEIHSSRSSLSTMSLGTRTHLAADTLGHQGFIYSDPGNLSYQDTIDPLHFEYKNALSSPTPHSQTKDVQSPEMSGFSPGITELDNGGGENPQEPSH